MDVVIERCCGLDVHKRTVVACLVTPGPRSQPQKEIRTFGTMTDELLQLADWLMGRGVRMRRSSRPGCTGSPSGIFWRDNSACCW